VEKSRGRPGRCRRRTVTWCRRATSSSSSDARLRTRNESREPTAKKTLIASERDRPDVAWRRQQWMAYQDRIDPARLVFFDETWQDQYGAAARLEPVWSAALRHDRVEAPWLIDGPINGQSFRLYIDKVLIPTLRPGDIVVMDNLGSHRSSAKQWTATLAMPQRY
jgi:hypothetical protein